MGLCGLVESNGWRASDMSGNAGPMGSGHLGGSPLSDRGRWGGVSTWARLGGRRRRAPRAVRLDHRGNQPGTREMGTQDAIHEMNRCIHRGWTQAKGAEQKDVMPRGVSSNRSLG